MSIKKDSDNLFTVPLTLTAHIQAKKLGRNQENSGKAKQVYLNTLAVYAVNYYLLMQGFETDLEQSDSWNTLTQMLMDSADLKVKKYGFLECRPILPDAEFVSIPEEVREDRIAYVGVQFHESLREATLVGFVEKATSSEIPLSKLRSLADLPDYLYQLKQSSTRVKLSNWLEHIFDEGWEILHPPQLAFRFRSPNQTMEIENQKGSIYVGVTRGKLLELGKIEASKQVNLMITLMETATEEIDISVKVYPTANETHLPPNLQLILLDEDGITVMQAIARQTESIELKFGGYRGEKFSIEVSLNGKSISEAFEI